MGPKFFAATEVSLFKRGRLVKKFSFPLEDKDEEREEVDEGDQAGGEREKKTEKGDRDKVAKPRRNFNHFNAVGLVYQVWLSSSM